MIWRFDWLPLLAFVFSIFNSLGQADAQDPSQSETGRNRSFAVVELFTSQGCSSCPPADATLAEIDKLASESGLNVYCLSFHVDYWNRLGWNDPYSDRQHSDRQRSYASAAGSSRVYTPQMVVNGTTEFVGSHQLKAQSAIRDALQQKPKANIELAVNPTADATAITVGYVVTGTTDDHVLNVALTNRPEPNVVDRGENAGRELKHVGVVHELRTVPLSKRRGEVRIAIPETFQFNAAQVCVFLQHEQSKAISAAARAAIDAGDTDLNSGS
tara:strand:- start:348722 stop:349534 length:813 start_codon:yes stop_codon:yes gene_type:complete